MSKSVALTGQSLSLAQVVEVARHGGRVEIDPAAAERTDRARAAVERLVAAGAAVYGVNTGFGKLAAVRIAPDRLQELQRNLIVSHVAGLGDPLPTDVVRAVLLLRANVLLRETSGVRSHLARCLVQLLNAGIHPVIPEQGSVGASGDLAPLAHVAYAMMGEGAVTVLEPARLPGAAVGPDVGRDDAPRRVPAREALAAAGIEPVEFQAKEGLAFINGTQVQSAVLALAVHDAQVLWRSAHVAAAMSLEALMGTPVPFDERIHAVRPHPGQVRSAALMRELLVESEIREAHRQNDPRVQDAYSLRCTPQILGAVADAIEFAQRIVETELNAATDNPLVFGDEILSGGNFHGQPVALALDVLGIALTTLTNVAERRIDRLVNPDLSQGLPPFLVKEAGLHSGLMMVQIAAAGLAAECRVLATPASVQSIPTDASQEDVVPMGMTAAVKLRRILVNAQRVVACEFLSAAQGLEFRKPLKPGRGVARGYDRVRVLVPRLDGDRPLSPDIERLCVALAREELT